MAGKKRSQLGRLSVGALLGLLSGGAAEVGDHAPRSAPVHHRALQTGSNIVWIDPLESDATELQVRWCCAWTTPAILECNMVGCIYIKMVPTRLYLLAVGPCPVWQTGDLHTT